LVSSASLVSHSATISGEGLSSQLVSCNHEDTSWFGVRDINHAQDAPSLRGTCRQPSLPAAWTDLGGPAENLLHLVLGDLMLIDVGFTGERVEVETQVQIAPPKGNQTDQAQTTPAPILP
jgi:hypothetical protein